MVRFQGDKVFVKYDGTEFELTAVAGLSTPTLLDFCRRQYKDKFQKRFAEDLMAVLNQMGHTMNADRTVSLALIDPTTGKNKTIERASMTEKNRQEVWEAFNGKPSN